MAIVHVHLQFTTIAIPQAWQRLQTGATFYFRIAGQSCKRDVIRSGATGSHGELFHHWFLLQWEEWANPMAIWAFTWWEY